MISTTATDCELARYVANIVQAYQSATPEQVARGKAWYAVAHDLASVIGNGDVRQGAGIIAALSAQRRWDVNVRLAEDAANGNVHGQTEATLAKVRAMLEGADPEDVLPLQLKTGHFYRCILDPSDPDPVVIDRHSYDVATGFRHSDNDRGLSNKTRYATLAHAYRVAAREIGEIPSAVQAVTWVRQTEINNS